MSAKQGLSWARGLADECLCKRHLEAIAQEKALSDRKLIAEAAPEIWKRVRKEVEDRLAELKDAMDGEQVIRAVYDRVGPRISLQSMETGEELHAIIFHPGMHELLTTDFSYRFKVGKDDVVRLEDMKYGGATTVESLVRVAIERAFRRR
jgi:hypothetical protein